MSTILLILTIGFTIMAVRSCLTEQQENVPPERKLESKENSLKSDVF
ncbi:hypothetical protein [Croceivirga sp. JEA036]|nr:hypothetical protein [Croceivirga sp. JEA036]NJB37300.1 hypothetical protein [Croceivirga sp. JEA036]